jgi:aryl-alcohol dehydrogenase-like predicted oxidoreductase
MARTLLSSAYLLLLVWFLGRVDVHGVKGFAVQRRVHSEVRGRSGTLQLGVFVNTKPSGASVANETDSVGPFGTMKVHIVNKRLHSRIIFGTAALGKAVNPFELLDAAYEKGFRRFDLARTYGAGASERIFGAWMHDRGVDRNSIEIITKGGMGQDKYGNPNRPLLTRDSLQTEVEDSLNALGTDSVDVYMFHRDDPRIHVSKFVIWANELVLTGKTKRWGVSNWSFQRFQQAYHFAKENGIQTPSVSSPQFSLAVPKCEVWPTTQSISGSQYCLDQVEWYADHGVELQCWEVLAKGFMAKPHLWSEDTLDPSTLDDPVEIGSNEWRLQRIQKAYCYDKNYRRRRAAIQLGKKLGYKLSQVATLYPLSMGKNICVIIGTTNVDHLDDMVGLDKCQLDDESMSRLSF